MKLKMMGVYEIICRVTRYKYVGSSVNIIDRYQTHLRELRKGTHHSRYLQRAWDKYGPDVFELRIIRILSKRECLFPCEQFYIDLYLAAGISYNCATKADKPTISSEENRAAQLKVAYKHRHRANSQWSDPQMRSKMIGGMLRHGPRKFNEERSKKQKLQFLTEPEKFAKLLEAGRKVHFDPIWRQNHSQTMLNKWADPVWKAKRLALPPFNRIPRSV